MSLYSLSYLDDVYDLQFWFRALWLSMLSHRSGLLDFSILFTLAQAFLTTLAVLAINFLIVLAVLPLLSSAQL